MLKVKRVSTVEPRFTNLIRSWGPFVNRNVRNRNYFSHKNQCKMDESVPGPQVIAYLDFTTVLCTQIHKQNQ
jgi:hypothetical protein